MRKNFEYISRRVIMSIETNLMEMNKSLKKLKESGVYDV